MIDAVGGNAGSLIVWVEEGGRDKEGTDVTASLGYEGYWMGVVPFT